MSASLVIMAVSRAARRVVLEIRNKSATCRWYARSAAPDQPKITRTRRPGPAHMDGPLRGHHGCLNLVWAVFARRPSFQNCSGASGGHFSAEGPPAAAARFRSFAQHDTGQAAKRQKLYCPRQAVDAVCMRSRIWGGRTARAAVLSGEAR